MHAEAVGIDIVPGSGRLCSVVLGEEHDLLDRRYAEEGRGISEEDRARIFDTAARILGQCPDPNGPPSRTTGLALGKVQSGKTMSYIALTALAFDSGYRVVIVLAGRTNALAAQNKARFEEDLLRNRSTLKIASYHNPNPTRQHVIQSVLENDGLVLITVLKHQRRIADVHDIFSSPELGRYPVLIVDDEGDQASHNAGRYTGRDSAVYSQIRQLRDVFPLQAYVSYTATPQANLLADAIDMLSPQFCVLVKPGPKYTGGSTFFGSDQGKYVRIVPDEEAEHDDFSGVPNCLRLAIATFLVAGAILHLRKPQQLHSMLIHNSVRRDDHQRLEQSVRALLDGWKEALLLPDGDPGAQDVLNIAQGAYRDLRGTVRECPDWRTVSTQLRREIRALEIWLVNSLPEGTSPTSNPFSLMNNIMIGGNMLDRGVTIPGLAITYITRRARNSQADTIEQRARWFGYKGDYLDICRIFTSQGILGIYAELLLHEDDFWEHLTRLEAQGIPVTQWKRMFRLGLGLRPTRPSVARTRAFRSQGWVVQGRPTIDPKSAATSVKAVRSFFARHPGARPEHYGGSATHTTIRGCDAEAVIELLAELARIGSAADQDETQGWDSSYVVEYLERLVLGGRLLAIDALLMSEGRLRERTASAAGRINPMEGARTGYPGDYNIHDDKVQLQAHIVSVRDVRNGPLSDETVALALYVPSDPRYDLGDLQIPSA
jgi:hypothetical protein